MEEDKKHQISILIEWGLYERLKIIIEHKYMPNRIKRKNIKITIDDFVKECISIFGSISEEEIKKDAIKQLDKIHKSKNLSER